MTNLTTAIVTLFFCTIIITSGVLAADYIRNSDSVIIQQPQNNQPHVSLKNWT